MKMDDADYILHQISKSKKYDMELLEDEAEQRGMEKMNKQVVLTAYGKGVSALQINDYFGIPLEKVLEIIEKHGQNKA